MLESDDTIAAIATPAGSGGLGVIRISGANAIPLLTSLVGRSVEGLADRRLSLVTLRDARGDVLDEAMVVCMRGPRSFTGEDVVEVHGHGGAMNMAALLRRVVELGARLAQPGEFTRRALSNGRLDLVRAEALLGVIEASSERALRLAQAQLAGGLSTTLEGLRSRLIDVLAQVEAWIDFPEEDLGTEVVEPLLGELGAVAGSLESLASSFVLGARLREGVTVALTGVVNAGKSSLFNLLLGRERALTSADPGTTRDYLEATTILAGVCVTLIDTAGRRDAADEVERRGIDLGSERALEADLEVHLVAPDSEPPCPGPRRIIVASKSDLVDSIPDWADVAVSTVTPEGAEELRAVIESRVAPIGSEGEDSAVISTERQYRGIVAASEAIARARAGLGNSPIELVAVDVRDAVAALEGVLGVEPGDEVLDSLFARFCIGK